MGSRVLVALAIAVALLVAMRQWRLAVKGALVLVVIEGAVRKWLVPGAQDLVYFAKDLVLVGAYVGFFRVWDWPYIANNFRIFPFYKFGFAFGFVWLSCTSH